MKKKLLIMDFHICKVAEKCFPRFYFSRNQPPSSILRLSTDGEDAGEDSGMWNNDTSSPLLRHTRPSAPLLLILSHCIGSAAAPPHPPQHTSIFLQSPGTELAEQKFRYYGRVRESDRSGVVLVCARSPLCTCRYVIILDATGNEGIGR